MADTIRYLEDKINSSKTTFEIYKEEIKNIEEKLSEKGISLNISDKKSQGFLLES